MFFENIPNVFYLSHFFCFVISLFDVFKQLQNLAFPGLVPDVYFPFFSVFPPLGRHDPKIMSQFLKKYIIEIIMLIFF